MSLTVTVDESIVPTEQPDVAAQGYQEEQNMTELPTMFSPQFVFLLCQQRHMAALVPGLNFICVLCTGLRRPVDFFSVNPSDSSMACGGY